MSQTLTKPQHVYETIIRTTPEKLWDALTNPQATPQYYFNTTLQTTLQVGFPFQYVTPDGTLMIDGTVVEVDPPHKLVTTFSLNCGSCSEEAKKDAPSRVTYLIEPVGDLCRLTLIHDGFEGETATYGEVTKGWPGILANLKTWLETGVPLNYGPAAS